MHDVRAQSKRDAADRSSADRHPAPVLEPYGELQAVPVPRYPVGTADGVDGPAAIDRQGARIPAATLALLRRSGHQDTATTTAAPASAVFTLDVDSPLRRSVHQDTATTTAAPAGALLPLDTDSPLRRSRSASPVAEGGPATSALPLRRQLIDSEHDNEIFEVEIAKRRAQVTNMNLGGSKIKQDDPARKNLEGFFADPSHRKGTRSYPVNGPTEGGGGRVHPGTTVLAPSQTTLILGSGGGPALTEEQAGRSQQAESDQATAEKQVQDFFDESTKSNPDTLAPLLNHLLLRAKKGIAELGTAGARKAQHGVTHQDETEQRAFKINGIVEEFKVQVGNVLSKRAWETTVKDRNEYFASKDNKEMAALALARAKDDLGQASAIYAALYSAVGFDKERIGRVTSASGEAGLLEVHKALPEGEWAGFLTAVTADEVLLAFAITHGKELAAVPNAGAAIRVWQANPDKVTKETAATILGLSLVGGDATAGATAATWMGTVPIPDIGVLTTISGTMTSIKNVGLYVACGGDVLSTNEMRAMTEKPDLKDITTFYSKVSTTRADAAAAWTSLKDAVDDEKKRCQIIRSVVKAEGATPVLFNLLVAEWDDLNDRESVTSGTVARLLSAGLLIVRGKYYESGKYGKGAIYVFELAGQGRLYPEWHVHFKYQSKKWEISGGGWKNSDEKFGVGVKTFDNALGLQKVMEGKKGWVQPK